MTRPIGFASLASDRDSRCSMTEPGIAWTHAEMSILTKMPRSASVVAETPMECLTLSATGFRTVLNEEPTIALRLLATLAERLVVLDRRLEA